jgi:hypothetical protein
MVTIPRPRRQHQVAKTMLECAQVTWCLASRASRCVSFTYTIVAAEVTTVAIAAVRATKSTRTS